MEHELAYDAETTKNNGPVAAEEAADRAGIFLADVSHLCDRVLQRWMPHLYQTKTLRGRHS